jgi:hypothetical protein
MKDILRRHDKVRAVVLLLDQPYTTTQHERRLVSQDFDQTLVAVVDNVQDQKITY